MMKIITYVFCHCSSKNVHLPPLRLRVPQLRSGQLAWRLPYSIELCGATRAIKSHLQPHN